MKHVLLHVLITYENFYKYSPTRPSHTESDRSWPWREIPFRCFLQIHILCSHRYGQSSVFSIFFCVMCLLAFSAGSRKGQRSNRWTKVHHIGLSGWLSGSRDLFCDLGLLDAIFASLGVYHGLPIHAFWKPCGTQKPPNNTLKLLAPTLSLPIASGRSSTEISKTLRNDLGLKLSNHLGAPCR